MRFLSWILDFLKGLFGASSSTSKKRQPESLGSGVDVDAVLSGGGSRSPSSGRSRTYTPVFGGLADTRSREQDGDPLVLPTLPDGRSPRGSRETTRSSTVVRADSILIQGEQVNEVLAPSDFSISGGWIRSPFVSLDKRTPNVSTRFGADVDWIAIHFTGGVDADIAANWLCNPESQASAHFVIDQRGQIMQLARLQDRTWHIGRGEFYTNGKFMTNRPDRSAVGIELANPGPLVWDDEQNRWEYYVGRAERVYDQEKYGDPVFRKMNILEGPMTDGFWAPYQEEQIAWLSWLCAHLVKVCKIDVNRIVGHESAARPAGRKIDPGPAFPWKKFYENVCTYLNVPLPKELAKYHKVLWG